MPVGPLDPDSGAQGGVMLAGSLSNDFTRMLPGAPLVHPSPGPPPQPQLQPGPYEQQQLLQQQLSLQQRLLLQLQQQQQQVLQCQRAQQQQQQQLPPQRVPQGREVSAEAMPGAAPIPLSMDAAHVAATRLAALYALQSTLQPQGGGAGGAAFMMQVGDGGGGGYDGQVLDVEGFIWGGTMPW